VKAKEKKADPPQDGQRWVSLPQLHAETGVPIRTLNEIRRTDPGVLVIRTNAGAIEYEQPTSALRLTERAVRIAVERVRGNASVAAVEQKQAEADARKAVAAAAIEEMKQETMARTLIRADEMRVEVGNILGAIAAALDTFPSQFADRVLNLTTKPKAITALRVVADSFRAELRRLKLPPVPDDEADAA
jgi:phage terminase Nu1 subunit (DNA packaging protein)